MCETNLCRGLKISARDGVGGPPRLAAGAGDRNAETLKDFHILGSSAQFPRAFSLALIQYSQGSPIEMQAVPQVLF